MIDPNDVTLRHPEYDAAEASRTLVEDAAAGSESVKAKGDTYLPRPNPADESPANRKRYDQYLARAVYYNATGRTLTTMNAYAFAVPPALDVSGAISYVAEDVDGAGVSLPQQSQSALRHALASGRVGLLVDYPRVAAPATRADMESGLVRAHVCLYPAASITNWRTERVGAKTVLTLVVLAEQHNVPTGFAIASETQYRVLRLTDGVYTQEIWRKNDKGTFVIADGPNVITDSSGKAWGEIPFQFVGAVNNDTVVDDSPLYDIAVLNIGHYRNSADYEESVYMAGQVQPWMSGLSVEWRDHMEKTGIYFGSRAPILLPEGGAFGLAQAQANSLAYEAMKAKEEQMIALGARLLQPGGAVKTATEAQSDSEAETSVIASIAANVSDGYNAALAWMAQFMGGGDGTYTIRAEQSAKALDAQMASVLLNSVLAGKLPASDFWAALRNSGNVSEERTDEMLREEIAATAGNLLLEP